MHKDFQFPFLLLNFNIFLLLIQFLIFSPDVKAQCANKVSLTKVESTEVNTSQGSIEVNVTTRGSYKSQLFLVTGNGKILAQEKSGIGNGKVIFSSLTADDNYQVLVIFESEGNNSCAKRQISEISTLKNQI
ncbi:hypothetical protein BH23BAC1_BH23BAC1_13330 [soil metagenome]